MPPATRLGGVLADDLEVNDWLSHGAPFGAADRRLCVEDVG